MEIIIYFQKFGSKYVDTILLICGSPLKYIPIDDRKPHNSVDSGKAINIKIEIIDNIIYTLIYVLTIYLKLTIFRSLLVYIQC